MNEPLDELYLVWLYSNVGNERHKSPRKTYWNLCRELFTTPFAWFVPNDDARIEDGRELRFEFMHDAEIPEVDPFWLDQECSYLELLIGLSRRLAFEVDGDPKDWFWHLVQNMELDKYNDAEEGPLSESVKEVTERITWRTYGKDGHGGLFPLRRAKRDQTKTEIWYQLSAYVLEMELT